MTGYGSFQVFDAITGSLQLALNKFVGFKCSSNSFLLIEQRHDKQPIGTATVFRNRHHGTYDIGLMVGERSCWGQETGCFVTAEDHNIHGGLG